MRRSTEVLRMGGVSVYPFHMPLRGMPDLFHVACDHCPTVGFCGERDDACDKAVEHAKRCKEGRP